MDVEAKVIDTELATISKAEEWLAGASERVAERCELYKPPAQITTEAQYRDAKAARTQCRKDANEIDNERKALLRGIEDELKKFKSEVKDVLSPLTDLDLEYKALLDSYDEMLRVNREIELVQEYEAIASLLVDVVPFEKVVERYGSERGKVWMNKSTNVVAAKQMLADAVEDISEKERSIDALVPDEDRDEVKALFFSTLDLNAALAAARRLKEQRERVIELERTRAEYSPKPAPEPVPVEVQQSVVDRPVVQGRQVSDRFPFVMDMVCTWEQANMLCDYARKNGIAVNRVHHGTIADAYHEGGFYDAG